MALDSAFELHLNSAWQSLKNKDAKLIIDRLGDVEKATQKEVEQWPEYRTQTNTAMKTLWALSAVCAVVFDKKGFWKPTSYGLSLYVDKSQLCKENFQESKYVNLEVVTVECWRILQKPEAQNVLKKLASNPAGVSQKEIEKWPEYLAENNPAMRALYGLTVLGAATFNGYNWRPTGYTEFLSAKRL